MRKPRRTRRRFTRVVRARAGYFAGVLLVAAGLALTLGAGWGLVAAGVGLIAYMVLLYDVDEPAPMDPDEGVRLR
jgi:hypothetical protein